MAECALSLLPLDELNDIIKNLTYEFVSESCNILIEELNKKKPWVRDWLKRRDTRGASNQLLAELRFEDPEEYRATMRISPECFDFLLSKVEPLILKQDTEMREALSPKLKLEIALSYLATGNSYRTLQNHFRVSKSAICRFIPEVCDALYQCLGDYIKTPLSHEEWKKVEKEFNKRWILPGCYGAIDGKHVAIRAPDGCGTTFFNYKKTNSIVLFALVDHDYCFKFIDVGSNGSVSDGRIFQKSPLLQELENGLLPEGGVIVGDDAFPLRPYLMKPYSGVSLSLEEKIYNYRISRARRVVENAFGILVSRFRIFEKPIPLHPNTVDNIVCACCALHNFLRQQSTQTYFPRGAVDSEDWDMGGIIPGAWREGIQRFESVRRVGAHQQTNRAKEKRGAYKDYFCNDGAVPWQNKMIH